MTLAELRGLIRLTLTSADRWPDATVDAWVRASIRLYGAHFGERALPSADEDGIEVPEMHLEALTAYVDFAATYGMQVDEALVGRGHDAGAGATERPGAPGVEPLQGRDRSTGGDGARTNRRPSPGARTGCEGEMGWKNGRDETEGWLRQVIHTGLTVLGGQGVSSQLRWVGQDGETAAYAQGSDGWGHWLQIGTTIPHQAGDPGILDLEVDGDFGAGARLRIETRRGAWKGRHIPALHGGQRDGLPGGRGRPGMEQGRVLAVARAANAAVGMTTALAAVRITLC